MRIGSSRPNFQLLNLAAREKNKEVQPAGRARAAAAPFLAWARSARVWIWSRAGAGENWCSPSCEPVMRCPWRTRSASLRTVSAACPGWVAKVRARGLGLTSKRSGARGPVAGQRPGSCEDRAPAGVSAWPGAEGARESGWETQERRAELGGKPQRQLQEPASRSCRLPRRPLRPEPRGSERLDSFPIQEQRVRCLPGLLSLLGPFRQVLCCWMHLPFPSHHPNCPQYPPCSLPAVPLTRANLLLPPGLGRRCHLFTVH